MLHNVLLNAGVYTEIAKTGKYINVVLASGEITARIRLDNNQVFETKLISGMSFPVDAGFSSVAFLSDTTQQTKIWLGELPLNYAPSNSRIVGSSSLKSETVKSFYNTVSELLPAEVGRGKVTISPKNDIFIGGAGLSENNAIKIPANTLYEISTQGQINSFTTEPTATPKNVVTLAYPLNKLLDVNVASRVNTITYSKALDRIYFTDSNTIKSVDAVDLTTNLQTIEYKKNLNTKQVFVENDKLYIVVADGSNTTLVTIDLLTGAKTLRVLMAGQGATGKYWIYNGIILHVNTYASAGTVWTGNVNDTGVLTQTAPTGMTSPAEGCLICANGDFLVGVGSNTAKSTDGGLTWSAEVVQPIYLIRDEKTVDTATGAIYIAGSDNTKLMKSIDNGDTWIEVLSAGFSINSISAVADFIYVSCNTAGGTSKIYHSTNGGQTWGTPIDSATLTSNTYAILQAQNDSIYIGEMNGNIKQFAGTTELVGGVDVAVMSEVN